MTVDLSTCPKVDGIQDLVTNPNDLIPGAKQRVFVLSHASVQSGRGSLKVSSADEVVAEGGGGRLLLPSFC